MKSIKIIITLFVIPVMIFSIQGCTNKGKVDLVSKSANSILPVSHKTDLQKKLDETPGIDVKLSKNYKKNTWNFEKNELNSSAGILARDNDLILLDGNDDKILLLDYDGNIIKTVGTTGSGPLEFSNPTAITTHDNKIYIVDGKNDRVQILDESLNYIKEIKLERKENSPEFSFQDIAVDKNGTIYVTGNLIDNPGILYYKENDAKGHWINEYFNGYLAEDNGEVYAINSGMFYAPEKNEFGCITGENFLLKVTEEGLKKIEELPFGINTYDFVFDNKEITSVSACFYQLLRMNNKGEYIDSVGNINLDRTSYGHITKDKSGNYYATDSVHNNIHVFKKVN